ncbi:hypothetical protein EDC01DRAFT_333508 [Geopyxis carbonaria]|nr:hypothetical protein EDC01DRAFT_333508 [Geopyxis carbonaria]
MFLAPADPPFDWAPEDIHAPGVALTANADPTPEFTCVICFEDLTADKNITFYPCRHTDICMVCVNSWVDELLKFEMVYPSCPSCRGRIWISTTSSIPERNRIFTNNLAVLYREVSKVFLPALETEYTLKNRAGFIYNALQFINFSKPMQRLELDIQQWSTWWIRYNTVLFEIIRLQKYVNFITGFKFIPMGAPGGPVLHKIAFIEFYTQKKAPKRHLRYIKVCNEPLVYEIVETPPELRAIKHRKWKHDDEKKSWMIDFLKLYLPVLDSAIEEFIKFIVLISQNEPFEPTFGPVGRHDAIYFTQNYLPSASNVSTSKISNTAIKGGYSADGKVISSQESIESSNCRHRFSYRARPNLFANSLWAEYNQTTLLSGSDTSPSVDLNPTSGNLSLSAI